MVLLIVMTDNHHTRRRFLTSSTDDDDIITNLPEDLINPILERLPVKDAVRTSVLSKKWRYRWTTMRTLDFHFGFSGQFIKTGAFSHNGFTRVISQIMIHHQGPILNFLLHIPKEIFLDRFQEGTQHY
ncbi:putative F-box domain, leucine-rich repeat domain superfamily, F-box-like domain superfamily [Helianthus anomalus]